MLAQSNPQPTPLTWERIEQVDPVSSASNKNVMLENTSISGLVYRHTSIQIQENSYKYKRCTCCILLHTMKYAVCISVSQGRWCSLHGKRTTFRGVEETHFGAWICPPQNKHTSNYHNLQHVRHEKKETLPHPTTASQIGIPTKRRFHNHHHGLIKQPPYIACTTAFLSTFLLCFVFWFF